jgi:hypothetical protein
MAVLVHDYISVTISWKTSYPSAACELMDCWAAVFVGAFSNSFLTFSVVVLVLRHPEHLLSSACTQLAL